MCYESCGVHCETVDYVWVLARQFDRFAEAVTEAGRKTNKAAAVEAVCFAAYALAVPSVALCWR